MKFDLFHVGAMVQLVDQQLLDQQLLDQQLVDQQLVDQQLLDQQLVDHQLLDQQLLDQQLVDQPVVPLCPVVDPCGSSMAHLGLLCLWLWTLVSLWTDLAVVEIVMGVGYPWGAAIVIVEEG